ncbi:hypothetical protein DFH27DRAFT_545993, partial [Peziza echinospora]
VRACVRACGPGGYGGGLVLWVGWLVDVDCNVFLVFWYCGGPCVDSGPAIAMAGMEAISIVTACYGSTGLWVLLRCCCCCHCQH